MSVPLQEAIIAKDTDRAITLICDNEETKRNINRQYYWSEYKNKVTTLYLASDIGLQSVVEILLQIPEIDVNFEADRGLDTPLHAAASGGFAAIVKLLINVKAHCIPNMLNSTPIQRAAANGHPEALDLLLRFDQKLMNAKTLNMTPLHWACKHGHLQCVVTLVSHGADTTLTNSRNQLAIELAKERGHSEIVRYLTGPQDDEGQESFTSEELAVPETTENGDDNENASFDASAGQMNLRSIADFGAHQAHFEEEQQRINRDYSRRIGELEAQVEKQQSFSEMLCEDIEDIKTEENDLRSIYEKQDHRMEELATAHNQLQKSTQLLENSHNMYREETQQKVSDIEKRLQRLEMREESRKPQSNTNTVRARHLCGILQENFPYMKDNILANDHVDNLFSKKALNLEDLQAIEAQPYGVAQTHAMLIRLLSKPNPTWVFHFIKSLERLPTTKYLVEIFRG